MAERNKKKRKKKQDGMKNKRSNKNKNKKILNGEIYEKKQGNKDAIN